MPIVCEEVPCNFVGQFKVGDNIAVSCDALCLLLKKNENQLFNRISVVQAASISEACLGQLIFRAKHYNVEGVPNISPQDQQAISGKKVDKLNDIINVLRKYGVLDDLGDKVYISLHQLKKLRNKVHIDDMKKDENWIFDNNKLHWAINLNSDVVKFLSENFPRPKNLQRYLQSLTLPRWTAVPGHAAARPDGIQESRT